MRKRAQRKAIPINNEPKHIIQKTRLVSKPAVVKKKWRIAISLASIFILVLFLNTYFNVTSEDSFNPEGDGLDKFYLSGPDPYYNMRIVDETLYGENAGRYPFYSEDDPLLNYPLGRSGSRAPLFNMLAIGFSRLLTPFMDEIDAVGYSMQFIPALFGALLIIPVYLIGKTLFGKKEGILAALLIAFIPIHLSSGHGSAYTLFDHDSFNLFLFFVSFFFVIKSIKEKDSKKSIVYALLGGIPLAALSMTWVEAQFLYVLIAIYVIVQMIVDIFTSKIELRVARSASIVLFTGYLVSLPVLMSRWGGVIFKPDIPFFLCIGVTAFGIAYYIFGRKKIPWTLSLPAVLCIGGGGLAFLYIIKDISTSVPFLASLTKLSKVLYGTGIYGNKVSMTIAEAGTYSISRTVMSFGPALYWIAIIGLVFLMYYFVKNTQRRDFLFISVIFIVEMWLTGVAGRFLNDLVPLVALLSAWIVWQMVEKIDYKQMIRNVRSAGGGIHGLRRGMNFLHIFGIIFIAFLIILPNAYLAFDAAIPGTEKEEVFGDLPSGAFGTSLGKEAYWVHALSWLKEQDTEIENPVERPAFISWWDYGFYEVAIGDHPTVADNFQDGIPPAANFHTSKSENEAVIVWIVRLLEGEVKENNGKLSNEVVQALEKNIDTNITVNIIKWIEDPESAPSYDAPIGEEYDENLSKGYPVGQQWPVNAVYHDVVDLLTDLNDEEITWLYHDIQEATGESIRYYGVEGYDKQIFNIFGFLADKSLLMVSGGGVYNSEDDFVYVEYIMQSGNELTFEELSELSDEELRLDPPINTQQVFKDAYFETMFYRTYVGVSTGESGSKTEPDYQLPCMNMKHFYAEYVSPLEYMYYQGKGAVVIAKYYEGAFVNGTVNFQGSTQDVQVVVQKNITQYGTEIPVDHDQNNTINGNFSVIVPAGNITLQIRRNIELDQNAFVLKNVTFNDALESELAPIKDDEAMRIKDNYSRFINISIDPANIDGFVYLDNNDNNEYNITIDEPLENILVTLLEITEFDPNLGQPLNVGIYITLETDDEGYYNTSNLMPGYYLIRAEMDDFVIHENYIKIYSGNMSYNISKPKLGNVNGNIYFDSNGNDKYDVGEEMNNVDVELKYSTLSGITKIVDTYITDETGSYSFSSLIPGPYNIYANKLPNYEIDTEISIMENETTTFNISIAYALVSVNGNTMYGENNIANITTTFLPDISIENNTGKPDAVISDVFGAYTIKLYPGLYNVTINEIINENGTNVTYTYSDQLEIQIGEGTKTFDIIMSKIED